MANRTPVSAVLSFAFAGVALVVSGYLTLEHYDSSVTLACPESSTVNCARVTTSEWSTVGPVPVALLGLVYFAVLTALCTPIAWRQRRLDLVRVAAAGVGVLTALYLVYVELFDVGAICLWCTAVHVCTLAVLGTVLWTVVAPQDSRAVR